MVFDWDIFLAALTNLTSFDNIVILFKNNFNFLEG